MILLRNLRKTKNLNQHKIGMILDLPQSRISEIEHGKRKLKYEEALKLAHFFGIKVEDLLGD